MPTEAFDTYEAIGIREDLSDMIYRISPTDTPFMSSIGQSKASQTLHEWQEDSLADAVITNKLVEGDDVTLAATEATKRRGNVTQISGKNVTISGTTEAVDSAGRKSEMAYQLAKRSAELKRDMEKIMTGNQAAVGGNATTARELGSLRAWIATNDSLGASPGASGGHHATTSGTIAVAVDGATRALTESLVKTVIKDVWNEGGDPTMVMCGPVNKQNFSSFTGASTRFDKGEDKSLTAAFDVYVSDFGTHRVVANRFSRDRDLFVLTPSLWSVAYLRSFRQWPIAKAGDAEKRQLIVEYTLRSNNEAGSGVVADLTS